MFTSDGKHDTDIECWVKAEDRMIGALHPAVSRQNISVRLAVRNGVLMPIKMYGSENSMW